MHKIPTGIEGRQLREASALGLGTDPAGVTEEEQVLPPSAVIAGGPVR